MNETNESNTNEHQKSHGWDMAVVVVGFVLIIAGALLFRLDLFAPPTNNTDGTQTAPHTHEEGVPHDEYDHRSQ